MLFLGSFSLHGLEQAKLTVLQASRDPPVFTSHLSIMVITSTFYYI